MKQLFKKIQSNQFIGNTNWLLFQRVYSMGLSLVVGALSARYLGPSNYGLIGYGASLVNLFSAISQLGVDSILMNEMVISPQQKGKIMGTALVMRLISSSACFACAMILVMLMEPGNYILWGVTALQAFAIICKSYELLNEWFLAELKSKYYVIANICGETVVGVWKIILLVLQASVLWFATSTTIQALVCGSIVIVVFWMLRDFKLGFSNAIVKTIWDKGKHYVLAGLAVSLYTQMDKVMVGKMLGERQVGIYTAAMTIAALWEFIPSAIYSSARASILESKVKDETVYYERLKLLFFGITIMSISVGVVMQIFGKWFVLLLYGKEYLEAIPILKLLIWSTGFAMIGVVRNVWSIAEDKNRYSKYYTICGAVFNLVLNYITIPVWGIVGAAVSTCLAQAVVLIAPMFWKETRSFVGLYIESFGSWSLIRNWIRKV